MKNIIIFLFVAMASAPCWSQDYNQRSAYSFDTVVSIGSGKVDIDDVEGDESMHNIALALDFHRLPLELELRYSNVQPSYTESTYFDDVLVERLELDGNIDNWGIAAKLDLSWNCREACVYLMAGYNQGELSVDAEFNGDSVGDYTTDANYAHWGVGFRYDFTSSLRASIEYLSYDIGEQELDDVEDIEIGTLDFGKATAWQAGIGYKF